jgi:uncharacterized membrane protein
VIPWVFALYGDLAGRPDNKQTVAFVASHLDVAPGDGTVAFADFRNTALYSPVGYLPQAAGLTIGRWAGLPLLLSLYLARLLNLAACIGLCYWASRQLPYAQLTLVLILLSPLFLFEAASLSADAATYALTVAFTALVLRASRERPGMPVSNREIAGLCALGALVSLTKPSAAPVPLMVVLLLWRRRGPAGRPWREMGIVIGVSWVALLGWTLLASHLYVPANPLVTVEPRAQLEHVLGDPVRFLGVVRHTIEVKWQFYARSAVGMLGWLDTHLRSAYIDGFFLVLVLSGLVPEPGLVDATWRERLVAAALIGVSYLLLAFIMYLTWTAPGADVIEGVQGRYFLPLATLWAVLLQWPASVQARASARVRLAVTTGCLVYAVFFLGHAFQSMARRFWL